MPAPNIGSLTQDVTKTSKTRIIQKHDTEANWQKATNFVPKKGEMIVYDIDSNHNYERIKIGDGEHIPNDLQFVTDNYYTKSETDTKLNGKQNSLSATQLNAVNSGITSTKVTTYDGYQAKIDAKYTKPNNGIPKDDLASDVQTSLGKANTALQTHQTITTGSANGTIAVGGTDVHVKGLGSLAYKNSLTKSDVGLGNVENKSSTTIRSEITKSNVTTALGYTPLNSSLKGANSGIAELDENGKVPSSQLPSYVDDVLEYTAKSDFPATGETGKIYVDKTTNLTYRWSGSAYVEISPSLALGETSSTAYRGDRGKIAYDHSQAAHAPSNAEKNIIVGVQKNGTDLTVDSDRKVNIVVPTKTSDLSNDSDFITSSDIPKASTTSPKAAGTAAVGTESAFARGDHVHPSDSTKVDKVSGKGLSTNDYTTAEKNKLSGIASGAEVNQNAFSNIIVGSTTIEADSKTDSLTLVGSNVTLTPDATNDKVTIGITKANVIDALGYTPPTTNTTYGAATSSTLGLVKSGTDITVDSSGNVSVNDDSHNHVISNVDGLQDALDGKAASNHTHSAYVNQNAFSNVKIGDTTIAADSATDTLTLVAGSNITLTPDATNDKVTIAAKDTTYSAGDGISLSGNKFSNTGVRAISTGSSNGTISVNTNGTSANVAVKGLGSAAYTNSADYATATHTHNYAGSSSAGGAATSANKLTTARKISLGTGAIGTATSFDGSSDITIPVTSITPSYIKNGIMGSGLYYNCHPEGTNSVIPYIYNDLAYFFERGGTATITIDGKEVTNFGNFGNVFNGTLRYCNLNTLGSISTTSSIIIIELNLLTIFSFTTKFYIDFGATAWRAKDVKVEVMNSDVSTSDWTTKINVTNSANNAIYGEIQYSVVDENGRTIYGFNKLRITLTNFRSTSPRIAQIGLINYSSEGVRAICLPRDGGDLYGSIAPYTDSTYNLGSSTKKWNNIYANTFNGTATSANKLASARTITLSGDVSGSVSFDGSSNVTISTTVADDSHNHTIGNVDGLQDALNDKAASNHTHNYAGSSSAGGSATKAISDENGNAITEYIKSLSVSGKTITYTLGNGSTGTITTQDTTYTYTTGLTAGLCRATPITNPGNINHSSESGKYYYVDIIKSADNDSDTGKLVVNIPWKNYSNFSGATSSAAGSSGLVPAPSAGKQSSFLRGDGSWADPPGTEYAMASGTTLGLVKASQISQPDVVTRSSDSDRYYYVDVINSGEQSGRLLVNVPWTDTNTHYSALLVVGGSTGTTNASTSNGSTYLKIVENGSIRKALIKGTGSTTVTSDSSANISIHSPDFANLTLKYSTTSLTTGSKAVTNLSTTYFSWLYFLIEDENDGWVGYWIRMADFQSMTSATKYLILSNSTSATTRYVAIYYKSATAIQVNSKSNINSLYIYGLPV